LKRFINSLGMEMMPVPAGEFEMGADWVGSWAQYHERIHRSVFDRTDPEAWNGLEVDESPRHRVRITRPFYMASTEVTNAQYEAFDPKHQRSVHDLSDDAPVGNVSWYTDRKFDSASASCVARG
jgi:formylglycine-generating enzyme required for sulfatase activity